MKGSGSPFLQARSVSRMLGISDIRRSCLALARRIRSRHGWAVAVAASLAWGGSARAEVVYSKSRTFRIPFQIDAQELKQLGAREVRLYVSRDAGTTWEPAGAVTPDQEKFTYQTNADGEHWFSVKSIVAGDLEYPAGAHQPGLKVHVDTVSPELELQLGEVSPGTVSLHWQAVDPHLIVESLTIEATEPDGGTWRTLPIDVAAEGTKNWKCAQGGTVRVRGSVRDSAGNRCNTGAEILISPSQGGDAVLAGKQPHDSTNSPIVVSNSALAVPPVDVTNPSAAEMTIQPTAGTQTPAAVASGAMSGERTHRLDLAGASSLTGKDTVVPLFDAEPALPAPRPVPLPTPQSTLPKQGRSIVPSNAESSISQRPHFLMNTRAFRVAYEVEGVGPSGVGSVQVYITEDGGNNWFHYGADDDRQSPVQIVVPGDGDYGFAIRITNGLGLTSPPPQPGDAPEVSVTVDRVNPVVRLLPLKQGRGLKQNQVLIEWTAQDRKLSVNPVALYYSSQPTGPWELITDSQPNTGRFEFTVPGNLNQKLYVRLDVRDAAGNVTRIDGETPLFIDRSQPKARITEVESLKAGQ